MIGFETETWVSNKHYAMAMAFAELLKLRVLTDIPEEEVRAKILSRIGSWTIWTKRITCNESFFTT